VPVSPSLTQNLIAHRCSCTSLLEIALFHFCDIHTKTASQKTALKLAWWC